MPEDHFVIKLSHDQALVLSDWLDRVMGTEAFDRLVDDPAVWSALYNISGFLKRRRLRYSGPTTRHG
jgi:hypothetical protein